MATSPQTVLLTGASGFVGRHLVRALSVAYPTTALLAPRLDVRNAAEVTAAVQAALPEVCVHLAAVSAVTAAGQAPELAWQVNFHGTMHLAWALARYVPNCQLLFVSSSEAYGASFRGGAKIA
ncbi:NAD-dependent epimerase/dehydratase family protein [Rhodopila globiformis]|nr:NAD-dependent epimerase/dehydratase family protein [Rhodopila globiformis]